MGFKFVSSKGGSGLLFDIGLQGQPDGSSVRKHFESSCRKDGTGSGKAIFEVGLKFSASESRKNFNSTY